MLLHRVRSFSLYKKTPKFCLQNIGVFISAKANDFDSNTLQIVAYKNMDDVKNKDIERMEKFYDCSCKVRTRKDCFDMFT